MIALGAGGPFGPATVVAGMLVGQTTVHAKNGFFAGKGGVEVGLLYSAAALAFAARGYGKFSVDHALGLDQKLRHPALTALALAGGLAAGYLVLGQRDLSPPEGTLATPSIPGGQRNGETSRLPSPTTS